MEIFLKCIILIPFNFLPGIVIICTTEYKNTVWVIIIVYKMVYKYLTHEYITIIGHIIYLRHGNTKYQHLIDTLYPLIFFTIRNILLSWNITKKPFSIDLRVSWFVEILSWRPTVYRHYTDSKKILQKNIIAASNLYLIYIGLNLATADYYRCWQKCFSLSIPRQC